MSVALLTLPAVSLTGFSVRSLLGFGGFFRLLFKIHGFTVSFLPHNDLCSSSDMTSLPHGCIFPRTSFYMSPCLAVADIYLLDLRDDRIVRSALLLLLHHHYHSTNSQFVTQTQSVTKTKTGQPVCRRLSNRPFNFYCVAHVSRMMSFFL